MFLLILSFWSLPKVGGGLCGQTHASVPGERHHRVEFRGVAGRNEAEADADQAGADERHHNGGWRINELEHRVELSEQHAEPAGNENAKDTANHADQNRFDQELLEDVALARAD